MNRERENHRGETSAETAVLAPVLFVIVFSVVQLASYWMASQTAIAAATRGARAASMVTNDRDSVRAGLAAVEQTITELRGELSAPPVVAFHGRNVRVKVQVATAAIVPFITHTVHRTIDMPREEYVHEKDR